MEKSSNLLFKIILGSSSYSRRQILKQMGYEFSIVVADIDEKSIRKDTPEELVTVLAQAKADAIAEKLKKSGQWKELDSNVPTLLITADTVVVYKGKVQEKPTSTGEARQFLEGYSRSHASVVGSVLVTNLTSGVRKGSWESAEVYFHDIPSNVIEELVADEVTYKVAGGLRVENSLTSPYIESVVGNTDTVMGLPIALTHKLIQDAL